MVIRRLRWPLFSLLMSLVSFHSVPVELLALAIVLIVLLVSIIESLSRRVLGRGHRT